MFHTTMPRRHMTESVKQKYILEPLANQSVINPKKKLQ